MPSATDVDREGQYITVTFDDGSVVKRSLSYSDMISSLEHDDSTAWRKVEAIYYDPATNRLKVVYKA